MSSRIRGGAGLPSLSVWTWIDSLQTARLSHLPGSEEAVVEVVNHPVYALSFTSGGLLVRESPVAVDLYLRLEDWAEVRHRIQAENLLQARTRSSSRRLARELVQRLSHLSHSELSLLAEATTTQRGLLLWVAACRRYDLLADFSSEVVTERVKLLRPTLTHRDFDSFLLAKALWHPELSESKESTVKKLRATTFRMLREAGVLTAGGDIMRVVVSDQLAALLDSRVPSDVRFLPVAGR